MKHGGPALLVLAACGGGASSHEHLGDRAYREGRFAEAVTEYRQAGARATPALVGKLGSAALHAGDVDRAVSAYLALAEGDPTRVAEAARGLERAARLPDARPDQVAAAVDALRRMVPDRPLGRLAAVPPTVPSGATDQLLLPAAVAAAATSLEVDQVLVRSADRLRSSAGCEAAVPVYRTALRRLRDQGLRRQVRTELGGCALQLGQGALVAERPELAERWFAEASAADGDGVNGLLARIGWGDARLRQGDVFGAAMTWQSVISMVGAPDSLRQIATGRLNALASAGVPEGRES